MFVLPIVSVRGVAVTSGAWSAMYRNDSMLIRVEESSQKTVLFGRVRYIVFIQDAIANGAEYFDVKTTVLAAIVISGVTCKEEQLVQKLLKFVPLLVSNTSGNFCKE